MNYRQVVNTLIIIRISIHRRISNIFPLVWLDSNEMDSCYLNEGKKTMKHSLEREKAMNCTA